MSDHDQPMAASLLVQEFAASGPTSGDSPLRPSVIGSAWKPYLAAVLDLEWG